MYSPPLSDRNKLDPLPCQTFYQSLKIFESTKDFILGLQEVDPGFPGMVINEGDEIFGTAKSSSGHRPTDI